MTDLVDHATGYAEVNGTRLRYEVAGAGHPLVLVHSGLADSRMWDDQFPAFARHFRTVRYDLRGFGGSPMPPGEYAMRDDLRGLLDTLGMARAHVVGLSIGGGIALDTALAYPERVSALVLAASGVSGRDPSDDLRRQLAAVDETEAQEGVDAANERELRLWVDGPRRNPEQTDTALHERMRLLNRDVWAHEQPGTPRRLSPSAAERLGEVCVPTLVIYGDGDVPDVIATSETLVAGIAGARRVVFPGVAHMVNMERPADFNRAVLGFLAGV